MKKIILLIVSILLITGCGNKTEGLECTSSITNGEVVRNSTIRLEFKKSETTKITMTTIYELGKYKEYIDSYTASLSDETKELENEKGFTTEVAKIGESSIEVVYKFDINTVSELVKQKYDIDYLLNYNSAKQHYVDAGYNCK